MINMSKVGPQSIALAAFLGLVTLASPVRADPPGRQSVDPAVVVIGVVFDELEKALIREFGLEQEKEYSKKGKGKGAPPGLAKRDVLPPGLAKRDVLPPGLQGRGLPQALEGRLPAAHPGTARIQVGRDVVLIEKATRRVLDVIKDVLVPQDS